MQTGSERETDLISAVWCRTNVALRRWQLLYLLGVPAPGQSSDAITARWTLPLVCFRMWQWILNPRQLFMGCFFKSFWIFTADHSLKNLPSLSSESLKFVWQERHSSRHVTFSTRRSVSPVLIESSLANCAKNKDLLHINWDASARLECVHPRRNWSRAFWRISSVINGRDEEHEGIGPKRNADVQFLKMDKSKSCLCWTQAYFSSLFSFCVSWSCIPRDDSCGGRESDSCLVP